MHQRVEDLLSRMPLADKVGLMFHTIAVPADVDAVLAKCGVTGEDAAVIAGMVNAAWETYSLRYAQQVNASVRPDVKLFLSAISNGIRRAIAAVPKQSVSLYIKSDMQHTISFQ